MQQLYPYGYEKSTTTKRGKMIDASMLLHMISALDTLEKLLPVEESGEFAVKKREWEVLKKACWAEYRARERSLGF